MQVSIEVNAKEFERKIGRIFKRHIPYATKDAINHVAFKSRKALMAQAARKFDRPINYTIKAFRVEQAREHNLTGRVFILHNQSKYLGYQIDGGVRFPKKRAVPVPVGLKLNGYGNMPRGAIRRLLARPNSFSGKPRGGNRPAGIWQEVGGKRSKRLKLMVGYEPSVKYKKKFAFYKIINGVIKNNFDKAMAKSLEKAIRRG